MNYLARSCVHRSVRILGERAWILALFVGLCPCVLLPDGARASPGDPDVSIGFDAGANRGHRGADRIVYEPDEPYRPGSVGGHAGGQAVEESDRKFFLDGPDSDRPLYYTSRVGHHGWRFEISPGLYELVLRFNEAWANGPGQRFFDVWAGDEELLSGLDVYAWVGKKRSLEIRRAVVAEGSTFDVELRPSVGSLDPPAVAAIALRPWTGRPPRLGAVISPEARPTFAGALVSWRSPSEIGLDGYAARAESLGAVVGLYEGYLPWVVLPADPDFDLIVEPVDALGRRGESHWLRGVEARDRMDSPLESVDLRVDEASLRSMERALPEQVRARAHLTRAGESWPGWVNFRGSGSLEQPKKSWKFRPDGEGAGADEWNLGANFNDFSLIKETFATEVMASMGLRTYVAEPVLLFINEEWAGVFVDVEEPDEFYLRRVSLDPHGRCYKVETPMVPLRSQVAYVRAYENTNADDWFREDVIHFVEELNEASGEELEVFLRENLYLDQVLDWWAGQAWLGNDDFSLHNFLVQRGTEDQRWRVLPWDVDGVLLDPLAPVHLGTRAAPNGRGYHNELVDRIWSVPSLRRRYLARFEEHLGGALTTGSVLAGFREVRARVEEDALIDVYKVHRERSDLYQADLEALEGLVKAREPVLRAYIDSLMPEPWVDLSLNEATATLLDSVRVEVHWRGPEAQDLDGILVVDPDDPAEGWSLGPLRLEEGGFAALTVPRPGSGWLGLIRESKAASPIIDSIFVGDLVPGAARGRIPDGFGRVRILPEATIGSPNAWAPLVTLLARAPENRVSPGDSLRLAVSVTSRWRRSLKSELRLRLRLPGGGLADPEALGVFPLAELFRGQRTELDLQLPVPAALEGWGGGAYGVEVGLWESGAAHIDFVMVPVFLDVGPVAPVALNELCAANDSVIADEAGEFDDWVELYNPGDQSVGLAGLWLSDDPEDAPRKFALPDVRIPAGGYQLVWLDGDSEQGPMHASFRLDREGEELALFAEERGELRRWDWIVFSHQAIDWSQGHYPDGQPDIRKFALATPGRSNVAPDRPVEEGASVD